MNIGAYDVANNPGPAVNSKSLALVGAITIAVIFEPAGALMAGGDVVITLKKDLIDPGLIADHNTFILLMMASLLAAAIWLNLATCLGAPVCITHAIVGGVMGAGIAAAITVIIASSPGLPVNSAHIALGAVFGIGLLRESIKASYDNTVIDILHHHHNNDPHAAAQFPEAFRLTPVRQKTLLLQQLKNDSSKAALTRKDRDRQKKYYHKVLVKRFAMYRIAAVRGHYRTGFGPHGDDDIFHSPRNFNAMTANKINLHSYVFNQGS